MSSQVEIAPKHTDRQILEELRIMLGGGFFLTLADFCELRLRESPFVFGGTLTEAEIRWISEYFAPRTRGLAPEEVCARVMRDMEAIDRAFEIIVPDSDSSAKSSFQVQYGPEWLADILLAASEACPGTSQRQILREMPMVTVIHLVAAVHRYHGGKTERPVDAASVLAALGTLDSKG